MKELRPGGEGPCGRALCVAGLAAEYNVGPAKIRRYLQVGLSISADILRSAKLNVGPVMIEIVWFAWSGPEFPPDPTETTVYLFEKGG